ncbi:hypothetical protein PENTCL1PPCAC_2481, partial [Pristionchus entomophagus]
RIQVYISGNSRCNAVFTMIFSISFLLLRLLILILLGSTTIVDCIKCYSCANDFMVWQWRHFFLKRNYGLTTSDPACMGPEVNTDIYQTCHSTCFALFLNGTNKQTGLTRVLGVVRGCSSQYMTEDQHAHMGLGVHSKTTDIRLPADFDQYDIVEHWCYCASEYCNTQSCYNNRRYSMRRNDRRRDHDYWRYPNSACSFNVPVVPAMILVTIKFLL